MRVSYLRLFYVKIQTTAKIGEAIVTSIPFPVHLHRLKFQALNDFIPCHISTRISLTEEILRVANKSIMFGAAVRKHIRFK